MGIVNIIAKIVTLKPVEVVISKLLGKVFKQGDGGTKVSIGLSVTTAIIALISVAQAVDPGLGAILADNKVVLLGFVGLVQTIFMYYRKEEVL